tara:strand:- start:476 stop:1237 length:762 start_codon:yes stop_codon:yes gene_type:complete
MGKRHKHEEHVNLERWLVSYADFITLCFAFFVVMYATSQVDAQKLIQAVSSIRGAMNLDTAGVDKPPIFENIVAGESPIIPNEAYPQQRGIETKAPAELARIKENLEDKLETIAGQRPPDAIQLEVTEKGVRIRLLAAYFFDSGSKILRPEAVPVIDAIADVIEPIPNKLRVEGHSDGKVGRDRFKNWELSSDRALEVIKYLVRISRVDPTRMALSAYAHYQPITSNESDRGRALNRRIDIMIFTKITDELPF